MRLSEQSVIRLAYLLPIDHNTPHDQEMMERIQMIGNVLDRAWGRKYRKLFYTEALGRMGLHGIPFSIARFIMMITPVGLPKMPHIKYLHKALPHGEYRSILGYVPEEQLGFSIGDETQIVGFVYQEPLDKLEPKEV
jgi:hypothetical protein